MGNTGVTEKQIFSVIDRIMAQGEEPTINLIREILGTGSLSTISRHLKKWKEGSHKDEVSATIEGLDALENVEVKVLADFLWNEHPQIIALVLSYLSPKDAADILERFSDELRNDVLDRVASISYVNPKFLKLLNITLKNELSVIANSEGSLKGGLEYVNKVLESLKGDAGKNFLKSLESNNPKLAKEIERIQGETK